MSIHVVNTYRLSDSMPAEKLKEYEAALKELVDDIRETQPGTWLYSAMHDSKDAHSFVHYAIFRDKAARKDHHNAHVTKVKAIIKEYLEGGFKATILNVIASQSVLSKPTGPHIEDASDSMDFNDEPF